MTSTLTKYHYDTIITKIHPGWLSFFEENKQELIRILDEVSVVNDTVYPREEDLFRALYYHSPKDIKVVILGQDCYISEENGIPQAMGLSFSVPQCHKKIPPSLKNIFKEIKNCYTDFVMPEHGSLERWATDEKILLLNSALTVIKGKSNSHAKLWNSFTDKLIRWFQNVNKIECDGCVFVLMGNFAQKKKNLIDGIDGIDVIDEKHKIFEVVHPSPLSAHNGFFGSNIFKNINDHLVMKGKKPIKW